MDFATKDYNKLEKIGIKTLFDLCLNIPKSYTHTALISKLESGQSGVLEVEILPFHQASFYKSFLLKIPAFLPKFQTTIHLLIFHPKPFHLHLFLPQKRLFVYGSLQHEGGFKLIQPKIIQQIDTITPHFKNPKMRDSTILAMIHKYLTLENLTPLLPQNIITALLPIFYPDQDFLDTFNQNKTLPESSLRALKFIEIYQHMEQLAKKRRYFPAKFICDGDYQGFVDSLPFSLTPSQNRVLAEISRDLKSSVATRRVIMGDVGCGKTIVILASVVMTYPKKSILMVPTTILAEQIFQEAKKFLPPSISTSLLLGHIHPKAKQKAKESHFLIGTQALLYQDFDPSTYALIMVDEQHRFGTNQRQALQTLTQDSRDKTKSHFLQFSATPIPRTLKMLESRLIDFSTITDLPFEKNIATSIIHKADFPKLLTHIKEEIAQKRQIIIVYPLVEESERIDYRSIKQGAPFWRKYFKNVYATHGQDKDKEQIIKDFYQNGDILLATTLIEVGISLPRVSTIVILAPERLGLATLHQLRGRVSRNGLRGYCFLYTHSKDNKRLEEFCANLNGFEIAEMDLKYRSSGDLLSGSRQSGENFRFYDLQNDEAILRQAQDFMQERNTESASV